MIDEEVARELLNKDVYIEKKDGFTWHGKLIKVKSNSLMLLSPEHGKSIVSLEKIEEIGMRGEKK